MALSASAREAGSPVSVTHRQSKDEYTIWPLPSETPDWLGHYLGQQGENTVCR